MVSPPAPPAPTGSPRGPTLRLEGLQKRYGGLLAVDAVTQSVNAGQFIALVGASGSGKSTLLKLINRLVEADTGRVWIDAMPHDAQPAHQLRRSIGYVFQNIGLFPHLTVGQNIALGEKVASGQNLSPERLGDLLSLVDLPPDCADRLPDQLSGGQQQRVGVARALARAPGLMLLDEPFGALDPLTRDALAREYRALHDRLGLTTVMVTHDMAEALLLGDRVWVMAKGRIIADEKPAALLGGAGGEQAQRLVAVPRDQAERLVALRQATVS